MDLTSPVSDCIIDYQVAKMESSVFMRLTVPLGVVYIIPTKPKRAGEMYQEPLKLFMSNMQFVLLSDTWSTALLTERA